MVEGRGFRGGSDEKMRRMWLGLEIDVVGLPPLTQHSARNNLQLRAGFHTFAHTYL